MSDSKRSKEIEQALYDLKHGAGAFQKVVDQAKAEAAEHLACAISYQRYIQSSELDRQIDDLDYLMKRGQYQYLRAAS